MYLSPDPRTLLIEFPVLSSCGFFDPASGAWTLTTPLAVPRARHEVTLLSSGQVLVSGGYGVYPAVIASAEAYTP